MDSKETQPDAAGIATCTDEELEMLFAITGAFNGAETNTIAYSHLFDILERAYALTSCSIHLLEPEGHYLYQAAERGKPTDTPDFILQMAKMESVDLPYMKPLFALEPYRPREYSDMKDTPRYELVNKIFSGEIVKIPLSSEGHVIGALTLITDDVSENWFDEHKRWFGMMGRHMGMLIGQMLSYRHEQNLAIIQERERISRELHDGLSQLVGTVRLLAEKVAKSAQASEDPTLLVDASALEDAARDAYANVRDDMMGLRFIENDAQALVPTVTDYVERFQRQWGIETELTTVNINEPFLFDPSRALQLFRIIQEALTNVHRHADATHVTVALTLNGNTLTAGISDNGIGFSGAKVEEGRLGLKVMRERASQIGGELHVATVPGMGTTIQADIPLRLSA